LYIYIQQAGKITQIVQGKTAKYLTLPVCFAKIPMYVMLINMRFCKKVAKHTQNIDNFWRTSADIKETEK
jgi:hypothetical protein